MVAAGTDGKKSGEKDSDEGTAGSDDPMAVPKFKFDPESEKDAFGRDPKKVKLAISFHIVLPQGILFFFFFVTL